MFLHFIGQIIGCNIITGLYYSKKEYRTNYSNLLIGSSLKGFFYGTSIPFLIVFSPAYIGYCLYQKQKIDIMDQSIDFLFESLIFQERSKINDRLLRF